MPGLHWHSSEGVWGRGEENKLEEEEEEGGFFSSSSSLSSSSFSIILGPNNSELA
jgi:hypothetical protein